MVSLHSSYTAQSVMAAEFNMLDFYDPFFLYYKNSTPYI